MNIPPNENPDADQVPPVNANSATTTTHSQSYDAATTQTTSNVGEDDLDFEPKKRQKTSKVWLEFREVEIGGVKKAECIHCKSRLSIAKSKSTSHLSRHLDGCLRRKIFQNQQRKITLQPSDNEFDAESVTPALTDGKFDMGKMRESVAHWILMHEHPFTIVEEEGFNMMQRRGMSEWQKISRSTIKRDCVLVYELEKKKLMMQLKNVNKISVTTDLWRSTNQKLEAAASYFVATASICSLILFATAASDFLATSTICSYTSCMF